MVVKNIECFNTGFVDEIVKQLTENNINYLLIKNEGYVELHFDNYIYRFFCLVCSENIDETPLYIDTLSNLSRGHQKEKKMQPGFRKYNKSLIKNDNIKNKIGRR